MVDILTELLGAYASAGKMETRLTLDYPELEYTVQYRESDMDFAARLMERHGISYHFEQDSGSHLMVLTDIVESHATIGERPFKPYDGHHQEEIEHFWEWRPARRITTGAVRLTDYNFKTPTAAMETNSSSSSRYAQGQIESFDWPGDYLDQGRGDVVARLRSEGETGQDRRFEAQGDIPALGAGLRVTLGGEPLPGSGEDYLCLVAHHSYTSDNYGSGGEEGDGYAYTGRYVLLPADAPLVPELKTARADVKGPQTAVVVGDGEIDCDEYGRILVQFHWDLDAAYSMRCRVSQSWAGNGWGGMVIPRIGMEVVVEFLDGDPDKPLVTGCVYNGKNAVPY
ncbi:type VI secretion system Vgr family protein, partial [Celeribacter ethanolicus]|uniref:type VI secretion system Vgr family protein n=1 Tax=Celeribacter ethanolicus TaxID=1758178 RepID=UPI001EE3B88F